MTDGTDETDETDEMDVVLILISVGLGLVLGLVEWLISSFDNILLHIPKCVS